MPMKHKVTKMLLRRRQRENASRCPCWAAPTNQFCRKQRLLSPRLQPRPHALGSVTFRNLPHKTGDGWCGDDFFGVFLKTSLKTQLA